LAVKVAPGSGYIYVNIDPMLVGFDFQDADRKAVKVACDKTHYSLDADLVGIAGHDVFFMVLAPGGEEVNVQAIDGPSAGAATTLATIAALENRRIKDGYIITGTVEEDGSIGKVGGIFYKTQAASEAGASHFLVPKGQSVITIYKQVTQQIGPWQWVTYEPVIVDLNQYAQEQGWNLEIQEVSTIEEAAEIMLEG
jgi:predicted S18 family serine protease